MMNQVPQGTSDMPVQSEYEFVSSEEFDAVLERRINLKRQVLGAKRAEYAATGCRMANFNRAADMLGCSRQKALIGMFAKHMVSILDIVDNWDTRQPSVEMIEEKIGDADNYLTLLEAMMKADLRRSSPVSKLIFKSPSDSAPAIVVGGELKNG